LTERAAFTIAFAAFGLATVVGLYLVALRGPAIIVLGLIALVGGYGYTAPPFQFK
jgi:1,4-dihydroxy-2-naphthoate octaprenyltransferase